MQEEGSIYRATVDIAPYQTGLDCVACFADFLANGVPEEAPVSYFKCEPVWQEQVLSGEYVAQ